MYKVYSFTVYYGDGTVGIEKFIAECFLDACREAEIWAIENGSRIIDCIL